MWTNKKRVYQRAFREELHVFSRLLLFNCPICVLCHNFWTRSEPQNDRLNLSFVKDIYVDCGKLARNGRKTAIYYFVSSQVQKKYICILIWFAGACLEWRIAVSLYAVVPICCFIMVAMSPESPYWLICKSRSDDALKSLTILRGKSNIDLVNKDFASISRNYEIQIEQANLSSHGGKVKLVS